MNIKPKIDALQTRVKSIEEVNRTEADVVMDSIYQIQVNGNRRFF